MVNNHPKLKIRIIMLGIIAFSIAISGLLGFISAEKAKDIADIEKVIKESVIAAKALTQLPEPFSSDTKGEIPKNVKQMMYDKITAKYNEVYSSGSEIQKRRVDNLKSSILWQESDHFRSLGGGIRKIENLSINLNGDKAIAEADIRTFAKLHESNGKIFTPEATAHYKFSFVKENGHWKISKEDFDVLPGEI